MGKVDDVKGRTAYSALLVVFLQEHCYVEKKKKKMKKGKRSICVIFLPNPGHEISQVPPGLQN